MPPELLPAGRRRQAPRPRSVLAIDVGRRRIGLAGCDPLGLTVRSLPALARGRFAADLGRLQPLIAARRVEALVVGLPLDNSGQPTEQCRYCRRYGEQLAKATGLPLAWVNEHGSSWSAAERHGLHGDRSGALDSAAAQLLLEQWLLEGPEPAMQAPVERATISSGAGPHAAPS